MANDNSKHKQWYSRGYLPHFDNKDTLQFITYRLADSLAQSHLQQLDKLKDNPNIDNEKRAHIEQCLDSGYGSCILKNKNIAQIVINTWKHWDGQRYQLLNWVVMPNHVHIFLKQFDDYPLNEIIGSWKSFSAKMINNEQKTSGSVWAKGYWDRYMRDEEHCINTNDYIDNNPAKAGLNNDADWPFLAKNYQSPQE